MDGKDALQLLRPGNMVGDVELAFTPEDCHLLQSLVAARQMRQTNDLLLTAAVGQKRDQIAVNGLDGGPGGDNSLGKDGFVAAQGLFHGIQQIFSPGLKGITCELCPVSGQDPQAEHIAQRAADGYQQDPGQRVGPLLGAAGDEHQAAYARWAKFIWKPMLALNIAAGILVFVAQLVGYGPF